MTNFDGHVGEGEYAPQYNPVGYVDDGLGSMTNFDGNVGEGQYSYSPLMAPAAPVDQIPWDNYTPYG